VHLKRCASLPRLLEYLATLQRLGPPASEPLWASWGVTERGATHLHSSKFASIPPGHTQDLLQAMVQAPLWSWGLMALNPAEQSAAKEAGLASAATPGALGITVAALAGYATALNRLLNLRIML
jgi:hypothetical protein